jgi:predicted SAM-dependent methyltransferase
MKLNFGCGSNRLDGWQNFDQDCDITKPLPFSDNCADIILAEHVVEHISSHDALRFFSECYRILKTGGALRICVPQLNRITDREHARDLILGHGHQLVCSHDTIKGMMWAAGFDGRRIIETDRSPFDGHWKVIGMEKDDTETLRMEAFK